MAPARKRNVAAPTVKPEPMPLRKVPMPTIEEDDDDEIEADAVDADADCDSDDDEVGECTCGKCDDTESEPESKAADMLKTYSGRVYQCHIGGVYYSHHHKIDVRDVSVTVSNSDVVGSMYMLTREIESVLELIGDYVSDVNVRHWQHTNCGSVCVSYQVLAGNTFTGYDRVIANIVDRQVESENLKAAKRVI